MTNAKNIFYYWTAVIQKIPRTSQITGFIMVTVSVRYSACFWNVTLVKSGLTWTAERATIEAEASLQTKVIVFEVQSDTTGPGLKVHRCFFPKEPKGRREMVIDHVRVID